MNLKLQLVMAWILSVLSMIVFAFLAIMVSIHKIVHFDHSVITYVQGLESPNLTAIMKFFTYVGSAVSIVPLSILVIIFLYKVLKFRHELILFVFVMVGANALFFLLKQFFHRARPDLHRLIEVGGYSFPSGHATNACTLYGILTFLLWRHIPTRWGRTILIIVSIIMILAIGTSRIYLGVHYPSDILAGYAVSVLWLTISIYFFQRFQEKKHSQKVD